MSGEEIIDRLKEVKRLIDEGNLKNAQLNVRIIILNIKSI